MKFFSKIKNSISWLSFGILLNFNTLYIKEDFFNFAINDFQTIKDQYGEIKTYTQEMLEKKFSKSWFTRKQLLKLQRDSITVLGVCNGSINSEEINRIKLTDGYLFFNWKNVDYENADEVFLASISWIYVRSLFQVLMRSNPGKITAFDKYVIESSRNTPFLELENLAKEIADDFYWYFSDIEFFNPTFKTFCSSVRQIKSTLIKATADMENKIVIKTGTGFLFSINNR